MTSFTNHPLDTKIGAKGRPNDSAVLDVESTTKGFLKPRMTTAQRLALTPVEGLEVFDTDLGLPFVYGNGAWGSFAGIPAAGTSTDNAIVRWDGASGSVLQDSTITISDTNEIASTNLNGDITINPNGTGKVIIAKDLQVMGTTTTIESTTLEVVDANITINKNGNQSVADLNDAGLTVEMSDATDAVIHYDSTATSKWKAGEVGSSKEIATISDVQDLTNKRLSNGAAINANLDLQIESTTKASKPWPSMTTAQRDALTPVDGAAIKNTDTDTLEVYSTAEGAWVPVGAGGGLDIWATATDYEIDNVIVYKPNSEIYICTANHTSSADFNTDLANWTKLDGISNANTTILKELGITTTQAAVNKFDDELLEATSTGVYFFDGLAINADPTKFDIGKLDGHIVDAVGVTKVYKDVNNAALLAQTPLTTDGTNYIYYDQAGALFQSTATPTSEDRRNKIYLGRVVTIAGNVIGIASEPNVVNDPMNQVRDLAESIRVFSVSGNVISPSTTNALDIKKSSGFVFSMGRNFPVDKYNPNVISIGAFDPASFFRAGQTLASVSAITYTLIDPLNYDVGGTITPIGGSANRASNQRVYLYPNGSMSVQYGQVDYNTLALAIQGIASETFVENPAVVANKGVLLATISITKGCTDTADSSNCKIFIASRFGQGSVGASGTSVSNFQNVNDNSSVDPEIVYKNGQSGLTIVDAATPVVGNLFEIQDNTLAGLFEVGTVETKVKQLGFTGNTTAKINTTTAENISITDSLGTNLFRKDFNELYIEDFKENLPSAVLTASNVAITVNDAVNASYLSNTITTFTQSGALTTQYVETAPIAITNSNKWLLEPIKIQTMQGISGGAGTWDFRVFTSTDGVSYTDKNIIVQVGTLKNDKIITQLADDVTHVKLRWTIVNPDNATTLTLGGFIITSDAFPVGQTTINQSIKIPNGALSGAALPAFTSGGTTFDLLTNATSAGASILSSQNVSGYTIFTALKDGYVDLNMGVLSNAAGNYIRVYDYDTQLRISVGTSVQGSGEYMDSPPRFKVGTGQRFIVNATGYQNSGSINFVNIVATAYADNVIVDAATSGLNTRNAGTLTISATTTAPTKGTVVADKVWAVYNANDTATIRFEFQQSTAGTAGSGDYLFKMPSGLEIDTDKVTTYSTVEGVGVYVAPNAVGVASFTSPGDSGGGVIVVYDKDYVRIAGNHDANEGYVGSGYFSLDLNPTSYSGSFTVPIKGRSIDSLPILVDVSNERENEYTAIVDTSGNIEFQSPTFLTSANGTTGTGRRTLVWQDGFFGNNANAISVSATILDNDGSVSSITASNITTSGCRIFTEVANAAAFRRFSVTVKALGAAYKAQKTFIANAVSITNHVTGGAEYLTGDTENGSPIYGKTLIWTGSVSSGAITVGNIAAGLKNNITHFDSQMEQGAFSEVYAGGISGNTSNLYNIYYRNSDGAIVANGSVTSPITRIKVTIKYTK